MVKVNSWFIFKIFKEYDHTWLQSDPRSWHKDENYIKMKQKIKNITCINDCCERAIKLAQDFIKIARLEDKFQDAILCFKEHRENHQYDHGKWVKENLDKLIKM